VLRSSSSGFATNLRIALSPFSNLSPSDCSSSKSSSPAGKFARLTSTECAPFSSNAFSTLACSCCFDRRLGDLALPAVPAFFVQCDATPSHGLMCLHRCFFALQKPGSPILLKIGDRSYIKASIVQVSVSSLFRPLLLRWVAVPFAPLVSRSLAAAIACFVFWDANKRLFQFFFLSLRPACDRFSSSAWRFLHRRGASLRSSRAAFPRRARCAIRVFSVCLARLTRGVHCRLS
jgi:hypothetical protein